MVSLNGIAVGLWCAARELLSMMDLARPIMIALDGI